MENSFYRGQRCGYCYNSKIHPLDSFGMLYPEKAKYWSKNNKKSPFEVAPKTTRKYKFICEKCGEEFERNLNDLNRIEELCSYGLEYRDIIALIDARRIMRDILYHIFEVPYFKEGDAIVEINEEDYSIYYGASEVLEGDRYKTIGIYRYK